MVHHPEVDAAIAAIEDRSLSPQQAADEVAKQCGQFIGPAPSHGSPTEGDEEGCEDSRVDQFFWSFWNEVLRLAQEDVSMHDRIAHIMAALKARGSEGCEGWKLWGEETDWSRLPVFSLASREEMNGPQPFIKERGFLDITAPKAQALLAGDVPTDDEPDTRELVRCRKVWLNTNAFLARLWALNVWDGAFLGIASMRMHLEPLTLSSTSGPTGTVGRWRDGCADPDELQIEVAALWLRIAGAKMYACREIMGPKGNPDWEANRGCPGGSGGTWDGVDGYHPDRWRHWKGILQEVAKGSWRRNVIEAAQAAIEAMEKYEREAASE
ncbi:hypothetical protein GSI_07267 [Ganoderma sinense ZZ0214-1]|uniref:Uncharacterized protein n=1 Tax=Ganoderma sinense ZZ0214-1 TaxID=1077348 RepID=A0A2G8SA02_9APHY|nr:hypothetical protein GSI_07267 [Ganoderma sinense ZZ0214-1]